MAFDLCYTYFMCTDQHIWRMWAQTLHHWGVNEWLAFFLEAAGPFNLLLAQLVYLAQPVLRGAVSPDSLEALERMLEDTDGTKAFVNILWEASHSESAA